MWLVCMDALLDQGNKLTSVQVGLHSQREDRQASCPGHWDAF